MNSQRLLVTGGAGFIGSHLVDDLVNEGLEVTILDDLSTGNIENLEEHMQNNKIKLVKGDIRDKTLANQIMKNIDAAFHFAAIKSVPYSVKYPEATHEVNVEGTRNLLETSLKTGLKRFINISSCAVYGEPKYLPINEAHPTSPLSPYAESKLKAEKLCSEYCSKHGLETVNLRLFNVYGPRQQNDQYGGVIARFIERLSAKKPPIIYGDGSQTRDFIYVKDATKAFQLTLKSDKATGEIINIATGTPTTINQLATTLIELSGVKGLSLQHRKTRPGDITHSYADANRATKLLGFKPQFSLEEGLSTLLPQK